MGTNSIKTIITIIPIFSSKFPGSKVELRRAPATPPRSFEDCPARKSLGGGSAGKSPGKMAAFMGKSWKNMDKSWENLGKS